MIGDPQEEIKKDNILQQINDLLEDLKWGGAYDRVVVRIQFEGKFNLKSLHVQRKEKICEK